MSKKRSISANNLPRAPRDPLVRSSPVESWSDSSDLGTRFERKIDEIGTVISSFVENKKLKIQKNENPIDQDPPPFSYPTQAHLYKETNFSDEEAEYLFYLFRRCCEYPKEHMPVEQFKIFWPDLFKEEDVKLLFYLFQDDALCGMGLATISYRSFLLTLSVIHLSTPKEKAKFLARTLFAMNGYAHTETLIDEVGITVKEIQWAAESLWKIILPTISPLPKLFRKRSDGSVFFPYLEDTFPESSDEEEQQEEELLQEEDNEDYQSLWTFNNRIIAYTKPKKYNRESHMNWVESFFQPLVNSNNTITYSTLVTALTKRLLGDQQDPKAKRAAPDKTDWKLFIGLYGSLKYFKDLILDSMKYDLNTPNLANIFISEKEGFLIKNSGIGVFEKWKKHWCILRDGFFWYYDCDEHIPKLDEPERVICLQRATVVACGKFCFELRVPGYSRKFRCASQPELNAWITVIRSHSGLDNKTTVRDCFAPIRNGINARWFVDGKNAMEEMLVALLSAKREIYIAGWFISPYVYLRRVEVPEEMHLDERFRLDNVLLAMAQKGVSIYILPWNETKVAMDLGTQFADEYFTNLHQNFKVLRHPVVAPVYWSHHQKILVVDQEIAFIGGVDLCLGRWDEQTHPLVDIGNTPKWPGKDYYNPLYAELERVHEPWDDLINRQVLPRMPWHDVHMSVDGSAARDVARNFIQRWNHHKEVLQAPHNYLTPRNDISKSNGYYTVQVLRSLSDWSGGLGSILERSIYDGYIQAINGACNYIYIENQFFISSLSGSSVQNLIAKCLLDKIISAIEAGRDFKVIILLPQHPEGLYYQDCVTTRYIMYQQYKTISRGGNSMLEQLQTRFPDVDIGNYLGFFSLRKSEQMGDLYVCEQIYVHSKILLVDDRVAIIGSANTNDRSLLGDRDSEIAIKVYGGETISTVMNGKSWKANKFVHSLRVSLWQEHLGMLGKNESQFDDPMACIDSLWRPIAGENARILEFAFPRHITQLSNAETATIAREIECRMIKTPNTSSPIEKLRGHVIDFDLNYCRGHNLDLEGFENLIEDEIFV